MEEEKKEEVENLEEKEESLEEKHDDFNEIKEMQKTQEMKKIEEGTQELDKTFVKEVKEAAFVPNDNNKKGNKFAVIILILLLLAAGGLCVFFAPSLLKDSKKDKNKKTIETDSKKYASEYRLSGNGLEDFDLYFLQLENEAKNKVYSPLSIKYALAMLNEGTSGNSHKQIQAIIGDYKAKKYPNNNHMSFANAMFIRDTFKEKVKADYTNNLKEKYNADVITDSFATPDTINNWVSEKTFKLVNNLVDDVNRNDFFLVNALAIDMDWNNQIHCAVGHKVPCYNNGIYSIRYNHEKIADEDERAYSITEYPYDNEQQFYNGKFNGKENIKGGKILADYNKYDIIKELGEDKIRSEVGEAYKKWLEDSNNAKYVNEEEKNINTYLDRYISEIKENYSKKQNSTDFSFYEDANVKVFSKDLQTYDGVTLQYVGIMPKEKDLTSYIKEIKAKDVNDIISNIKVVNYENAKDGVATIVRGFIPFFKFEYNLDLLNDLKKLGIEDIFDTDKANLSNMVDMKGSAIDKAIHKANIEFSNDGIKAAAATTIGGFGATSGGFEYLYKIPVEEIDITFDKPYMYLVRDKDTGEIWFAGTVYEPISK